MPTAKVNWNQVVSLMALNVAVVISWIAYHNYQPKVLELFHFEELGFFLVVAQSLILVFIPPLAGLVGDYMIKKNGNGFVVLTVGIGVTAMTFMAVAFTVGTSESINLTSALPFMIVVWLISMNIFHSPANSMLDLFAPAKELPTAMVIMVVSTELLYAFENKVSDIVDAIGPVYTFVLGGVLLIVTGYIFMKNTRKINFVREYEETRGTASNFVAVLLAGLSLGMVAALIKNWLPGWLQDLNASFISDSSWLSTFVLVVAAIAAWPLANYVKKVGVGKSVVYGIIGSFILLGLLYLFPQNSALALIFCAALGVSYSYAAVAAFPFALGQLSPARVTVGAGVFFGSVELFEGIIDVLQSA